MKQTTFSILTLAALLFCCLPSVNAQSCGFNFSKSAKKIKLNQKISGEVKSKSTMQFISPIASNKGINKLQINEVGGHLKTIVNVCKIDENGNSSKVVTKIFNDTPSKMKNNSESFTYSFEDLQGYQIVVQFDGKSVGNTFQFDGKSVGNTFQFDIKLK